jgi:hypothetical protein
VRVAVDAVGTGLLAQAAEQFAGVVADAGFQAAGSFPVDNDAHGGRLLFLWRQV